MIIKKYKYIIQKYKMYNNIVNYNTNIKYNIKRCLILKKTNIIIIYITIFKLCNSRIIIKCNKKINSIIEITI